MKLIFYDGATQYDKARGNLESWAPFLLKSGLFMIHDYYAGNYHCYGGDVRKVVHDFLEHHRDFVLVGTLSQTAVVAKFPLDEANQKALSMMGLERACCFRNISH